MATITQGINPTRVDTVQQFPLGMIVDDPRGGIFAGNRIKYVQAANAIVGAENALGGDALMVDNAQADNLKPGRVTPTTAVTDIVDGVAHISIGDELFGWITIEGRVNNIKATDAGNAEGAALGASGTAGTLVAITGTTPTGAEVIAAIRYGAGRRAMALEDLGTNLWSVQLRG